MNGFSFSEINFWKELEEDLLSFIFRALEILQTKTHIQNENRINQSLYNVFRDLRFQEKRTNLAFGNYSLDRDPIYEGEKIDLEEDEDRERRMGKKPDFQWRIYDDFATYRKNSDIVFTIECKRLGIKEKRNLCVAYVKQGILRFTNKEWSYGEGASSGVMIGYIQNSNYSEIVKKVNKYCVDNSVSPLKKKDRNGEIHFFPEELKRKAILPKDFLLYHLWVDLLSK
ncbi:MAG: hypothetical protein SFU98_20705 [Leptospiraceae bacterium]|nr:hypothetical protein [Leptospiraceae bacterium]